MTRKPPDIDFVLRRPFIQFSGDEILAAIKNQFLTEDVDIEIATLAIYWYEEKRGVAKQRCSQQEQAIF